MSDDDCRVRLTNLARAVYGEDAVLHCYCEPTEAWSVRRGEHIVAIIEGPIGALLAALLVLADEARIPLTADQVTRDALQSCRRDREALTRRIREERAKVAILDDAFRTASAEVEAAEAKLKEERAAMEQLASDFEANKGIYQDGEEACLECARELRARARKP